MLAPAKLNAERLPAESPMCSRRDVRGCSGESYLHSRLGLSAAAQDH